MKTCIVSIAAIAFIVFMGGCGGSSGGGGSSSPAATGFYAVYHDYGGGLEGPQAIVYIEITPTTITIDSPPALPVTNGQFEGWGSGDADDGVYVTGSISSIVSGTIEFYLSGSVDDSFDFEMIPTTEPAADASEPNDGFASAAAQTVGTSVQYTWHTSGDQDYISFDVNSAPAQFTIETTDIAGDTILYLYDTDANGNALLDSNDDWGSGLESRIVYTINATGTYYVRVVEWDDSIGWYNLSITTP